MWIRKNKGKWHMAVYYAALGLNWRNCRQGLLKNTEAQRTRPTKDICKNCGNKR